MHAKDDRERNQTKNVGRKGHEEQVDDEALLKSYIVKEVEVQPWTSYRNQYFYRFDPNGITKVRRLPFRVQNLGRRCSEATQRSPIGRSLRAWNRVTNLGKPQNGSSAIPTQRPATSLNR